jgi:probable HAF family extracellular repeat protein
MRKNRRSWGLLAVEMSVAALVTALIVPQHPVVAAKPGGITDLGTLGGDYSDAFGINNDPTVLHVVGQSRTANGTVHAFFWTPPGPMVDLGTLGGGDSQASDINNSGQIAGASDDASRQRWAVVWTISGGGWAIENLGTLTGACCAYGYGINNGTAGDPAAIAVVGTSTTSSGESHAVIWTKSVTGWAVQDIGTLPGDGWSLATDVNDRGEVVGVSGSAPGVARGFRWTPTTGMVALPTLGGETYALAINNSGDVAGLSTDASGDRHAVRWRSTTDWTIEDLGTLGGCCSDGYGINSLGDVVGVSNVSRRRSGLQHAFLANSSGMIDLRALRGDSVARDVNDFGSAVGVSGAGATTLHAVLWRLP